MARTPKNSARPFVAAFYAIDKMEVAVAYRTVTPGFTAMDVVKWLWPDDVVDPLIAAYPFTRYPQDNMLVGPMNFSVSHTPLLVHFFFHLGPLGMLAPREDRININPDRGSHITPVLMELAAIHKKFNLVRAVVLWLDDHATVGAARYYCPWLGSLLPQEHPFHDADGLRYKEPKADMTHIIRLMREAGSIVATGILADPQNVEISHTTLGIEICRDPGMRSQRFMVL